MSDEKPEKLSKYWVHEVPGPIKQKGKIDRYNLQVPVGFMQMARYRHEPQSR